MKATALASLSALVLLTVVVYWPGLSGGFIFDDYHAIVENELLAVPALTTEALLDAAFSATTTGPFMRPLAMLSFAANSSLSGLAPLPFKLTNLGLHILNALLVWLLLRRITPLLAPLTPAQAATVAWLAAAIWALHPINLTSVLYVVQRMTSLSTTFMLAALCVYAHARGRQIAGLALASGWWLLLFAFAIAAVLVKETALLLPLYIYALEACAFRFRANPVLRPLYVAVAALGGVLLLALLYWSPSVIFGGYAARDFTPVERLLTESRILVFYLRLIALPSPAAFGVFHDDIALSHGLLAPASTLIAVGGLLALTAIALLSTRRYVAFGIAWFLLGHALESSIYPLELVHEHRNYLPSVGVLLLLVLLAREALTSVLSERARILLAGLVLALVAAITATNAASWSDPYLQIELEAARHPDSARSQYEAGRVRIARAATTDDAALHAAGIAALERAAALSTRPALPLSALLKTALQDGDDVAATALIARIRDAPHENVRVDALQELIRCQAFGACRLESRAVRDLAAAVLDGAPLTEGARRRALEWLAIYYMRVLADTEAGVRILADLVAEAPHDYRVRVRYAEALVVSGQEAESIEQARLVQAALPWHSVLSARPLRARLRLLLTGPGMAPT